METKSYGVEYKVDEERNLIEGHASIFGGRDHHRDRVEPGAFTTSLKERLPRNLIKVLWQHDYHEPIGLPTRLEEDSQGLAFEARISQTSRGRDAMILFRDKVVDRMSIGYAPRQWEYEGSEEEETRVLKEVELYEISPVTFAANDRAMITSAKSREMEESIRLVDSRWQSDVKAYLRPAEEFAPDSFRAVTIPGNSLVMAIVGVPRGLRKERIYGLRFPRHEGWNQTTVREWMRRADLKMDLRGLQLKKAIPYGDLPLASRERGWDAEAAETRVREWAGGEEPNAKYRAAFLWFDPEAANEWGAYKLPIADVEDGGLVAVPRAIFAAAAALEGARGGVDLEGDEEAVRGVVAKYYAKMAEEWDDEELVPPWEKALDMQALCKSLQGILDSINGR